jgi:hypothetical protein
MSKFNLSMDHLTKEYIDWVIKHGVGRDQNDLRFGQYLCNHFLIAGESAPEIFYEEDPAVVFTLVTENVLSVGN